MDYLSQLFRDCQKKAKYELKKLNCPTCDYEDIYQDVFEELVQRAKNGEKDKTYKEGYIIKMCKNKWFMKLRKREPRFQTINEMVLNIIAEDDTDDFFQNLLDIYYCELPAVNQEILYLFASGFKEIEIRERMDLSNRDAVKNLKLQSRKKLMIMILNDPSIKEYYGRTVYISGGKIPRR